MIDNKEIKKNIDNDWIYSFQELTSYSQNKYYKIIGSLIIGIELIKLPRVEEYRPHLVIYPLWKENIKLCLDSPILLKEFYNKKGLQFNIPYLKHENYFNEVISTIKRDASILIEQNISTKIILEFMDDCYNKSTLKASTNSYLYAKFIESKFKINLYSDRNEAEKELNKIIEINWDIDNFKYFGVDIKEWLESLKIELNSRNDFLKQIEINKLDKKISKLNISEFKK